MPLGGAAALAIAMILALSTAGCGSKGGIHGPEASNGRYPWFKTASIKVNHNAPRDAQVFTFAKHRFIATESAIDMIMFAYGEKYPLKPAQVLGGPDWMKTEVFNTDAELPKSLSDQVEPPLHVAGPALVYPGEVRWTDAIKQVLRSLLINRFKLRIKHETKELSVYDLVLAKDGPKMAEDNTADRPCRITDIGPGKGLWLNVSCDFSTFFGVLSAFPELRGRVLMDKTGLHGRYSFKLHWTREMPPGMPMPARGGQSNHSAAPPRLSGPSLFTALQEQLGLKLLSAKAPVDVIVIEHIEPPTPN